MPVLSIPPNIIEAIKPKKYTAAVEKANYLTTFGNICPFRGNVQKQKHTLDLHLTLCH